MVIHKCTKITFIWIRKINEDQIIIMLLVNINNFGYFETHHETNFFDGEALICDLWFYFDVSVI